MQSPRSTTSLPIDEPDGDRAIYVRVVVDVGSVLRDQPDAVKDADTQTAVASDRAQIAVTATAGIADQETGHLTLQARAGDTLRFFAKSGSNNLEHAALIEDLHPAGDDSLLQHTGAVALSRTAISPDAQAAVQLAEPAEHSFTFWQAAVTRDGAQAYALILALYDRDEHGQPRFGGLYRWDLNLTIQSSPTSAEENPEQEEKSP